MEKAKKEFEAGREDFDEKLLNLKKDLKDIGKQIDALVSSLANSDGTAAFEYITKQINELHSRKEATQKQISDIEHLSDQYSYSDSEFEVLKDLLISFGRIFETMSVEQKRSALRTFIKKVIWDGENVHVFLFGDKEESIDFSSFIEENKEPLRAYSK